MSKKYEFERKSNLQVHWLLKIEISLIDKMAFIYDVKIKSNCEFVLLFKSLRQVTLQSSNLQLDDNARTLEISDF